MNGFTKLRIKKCPFYLILSIGRQLSPANFNVVDLPKFRASFSLRNQPEYKCGDAHSSDHCHASSP